MSGCPQLLLLTLLFGGSLMVSDAADFPTFLMRCSKNDPNLSDCFERAANDAIGKLKGGVPDLGVPPLDPLEIPKIAIKQPGNGRVSLDLVFENIKFYNVSKGWLKTKLDLKNNILSGTFHIPHSKMVSDYEVNGRVLVLPVKGKGKAFIEIYGSRADFTLRVVPKVMKGKEYFFLDSLQYQIVGSDRMKMKFTNLFGNRALGDSVNEVLNDNWEELYETVRPSFSQSFRQYFFELGKRVFNKIPAEQIFPERV